MKKFSVLAAIFCFLVNAAFSQTAFSPEIKRAAVFKNGYAFTYREGQTRISNGWAYTTNAPVGVLGTIWGYSTAPNARVMQLLAGDVEKRETERVKNLTEVILANEGARIRFVDNYNSNKTYEGTYEIVHANRKFESGSSDGGDREVIIALKTDGGTMFFPLNSIRNIEIISPPNYDKPKITRENRLSLKVEGAGEGQSVNLGIAALERGIRWIPAYRVEVKGSPVKEAKLELEAMLINELTDLRETEVNFVVVVPHFLFQDMMSPLSMNTAFAGVSSYFQTGGRGGRNFASNAIMSQVASTAESVDVSAEALPSVADEEQLSSFSAEQLYLYKADRIDLKKGERASLRLFSLTVPASEVFEWTLNDAPDTQNRYLNYSGGANSQPFAQDLTNKIWYGLRLKNQTGMPWTTAPALAFRDWKPLGQDMLTFTPVAGENILKITPATEITGTHTLEEKARAPVQLKYGGNLQNFDLITIEGAIKIRSVKKESVEMVLKRGLAGEVVAAGDGGKFSRDGFNLQSLNPNSVIKWNLNIPSGEKEIRYTYKIFVRR
ncbi:MAG TPA: hypothetical protein VNI84_06945 [Pyrinomonadaceae bacterium]|nr:hypothetical protein [Pyrinomonadaceae bacterium]